jgi:hypothetical protein
MSRLKIIALAALAGVALLPPLSLKLSAQDQPQGAFVERVAAVSAVVHDVDLTTRQVLLETADGAFTTVVAPEEVRNLPQLEVGDTVTLSFYGGIAASLAPAGEAPIAMDTAQALVRAEEGERPAGAMLSELTTTVTFDAFDPETGIVTFTGQSGQQRMVEVQDPEMRAFVETLDAGDQVDVTVIEIVALEVE